MKKIVPIFAALLLSSACGCGTLANMSGATFAYQELDISATRPFGGVIRDADALANVGNGWLLIADLPFSIVGDIATLPWAIRAYSDFLNANLLLEKQVELANKSAQLLPNATVSPNDIEKGPTQPILAVASVK